MKHYLLTIITVAAALAVGFLLARTPWQNLGTQKAEYRRQIRHTRAIEAERSKLLQEKSNLQSPYGMEQRARELGYRKPYEHPLELE